MMDKRFNSKSIENKWYKIWLDSGAFSSNSSSTKKPYVIMMPPPNVTGSLHIGHALTFTTVSYTHLTLPTSDLV